MAPERDASQKISYFYHGSVASVMACCCTHPLDLVKVHMQTTKENRGMVGQAKVIYRTFGGGVAGTRAFYSGLTASMGRQATYSGTRFAVYDAVKSHLTNDKRNLTGTEKIVCSFSAGTIGGFVGTPCDLVNVRMQNDSKLPLGHKDRRNYRNVFHGLHQIQSKEGARVLMNGWEMATIRAGFMSIGQVAMYETVKEAVIKYLNAPDIVPVHLACSGVAGLCGAALTMPFDVLKTRMMNAPQGTYNGVGHAVMHTFKSGGPLVFYSGFGPAAIRIIPQTVLIWLFKEQLRLNFGYFPNS